MSDTDAAEAAGPAVDDLIGRIVDLDIGAVAHGGVCVARLDGRVVFVRYALPGERARVRITEAKPGSFCRGEAVEILRADPRRVTPPCAHFGPGGCGGCDWQHASADLQRELKAAVVTEAMQRFAHCDVSVVVEPLPGGELGWRSRVRWALDDRTRGEDPGTGTDDAVAGAGDGGAGAVGPRRYRSHDVVAITPDRPCLIAAPELSEAAGALAESLQAPAGTLRGADEVALVDRGTREPVAQPLRRGRPIGAARTMTERAADRTFTVDAAGFWQAHRHAAEVFTGVVTEMLRRVDVAGGVAWDLYGGVGLFAPQLAAAVGAHGQVVTVESDGAASRHAAANLADLHQVETVRARVDRFVAADQGALDVALLDPPRSGAGATVIRAIAERRPALIVYVACDPVALARDTATLLDSGYRLAELRAFDAFPQTHHIECLAAFEPSGR